MEQATLLVMASLEGVRAGGIFTVDGNLARKADPDVDADSYDPHQGVVTEGKAKMIEIALEALTRLD
jgi:uridine phosphorylase